MPSVFLLHGIARDLDPMRFVHRSLVDSIAFARYLDVPPKPFVPLQDAVKGQGDALTIDDAIVASAQAALTARQHGHPVTLFVNSGNIEGAHPYGLYLLNAINDRSPLKQVLWNHSVYALEDMEERIRPRGDVKAILSDIVSENERQRFIAQFAATSGSTMSSCRSFCVC